MIRDINKKMQTLEGKINRLNDGFIFDPYLKESTPGTFDQIKNYFVNNLFGPLIQCIVKSNDQYGSYMTRDDLIYLKSKSIILFWWVSLIVYVLLYSTNDNIKLNKNDIEGHKAFWTIIFCLFYIYYETLETYCHRIKIIDNVF